MEALNNSVQIVCLVVSSLGAVVVIWGVLEAVLRFISSKASPAKLNPVLENEAIRQGLGAHLLLGLEIFIAADIISSVVSPTWQKVGMLAAIVAIRTVLSYFLRMEVKQG